MNAWDVLACEWLVGGVSDCEARCFDGLFVWLPVDGWMEVMNMTMCTCISDMAFDRWFEGGIKLNVKQKFMEAVNYCETGCCRCVFDMWQIMDGFLGILLWLQNTVILRCVWDVASYRWFDGGLECLWNKKLWKLTAKWPVGDSLMEALYVCKTEVPAARNRCCRITWPCACCLVQTQWLLRSWSLELTVQVGQRSKGHDDDDDEEEDDYNVSNFGTQPFIPLYMFVLKGEEWGQGIVFPVFFMNLSYDIDAWSLTRNSRRILSQRQSNSQA